MGNALLKRYEFEYDNHNNRVKATDPAGNVTSFAYDEQSSSTALSHLPVAINYPTFTRYLTYDLRGRVVKQRDRTGNLPSRIRSRTFDAAGNIASVMDEAGRITHFGYDALNRLVTTIAPDNSRTVRTYDDRNNLIMLQDSNSGIRYFEYDKNNRMVSSARPMGAVTLYEYDAVGNRTAVTDPEGQRIEYGYSAENRLTRVRYFEAGDLTTPVETVDFTYNSLGPSGDLGQRHPVR